MNYEWVLDFIAVHVIVFMFYIDISMAALMLSRVIKSLRELRAEWNNQN